ncbi:LolA family protein [Peribacillus acanthi]|uniref:LolA family protein n=1 Tax=Peribacillus acanthi TaxID=2171554 RepID=UPI000D3EC8F2|nr:hypothetical protein [Peribacillus acanthi]
MMRPILGVLIVTCYLLSGCSKGPQSDESMLFSIIDQKKSLSYPTFYLEKEISVFKNGALISQEDIRWWRDSINRKERKDILRSNGEQEIVITDDNQSVHWRHNKQLIQYQILTPQELESAFFLKEQTIQYLENLRDQYELTLIEEDRFGAFHTYRIDALPKKGSANLDDISIWIDKKSWMIVKEIKRTGDIRTATRVTKFQKNPIFSANTFFLHTVKANVPIPGHKKIMKPLDSIDHEKNEVHGRFQKENWRIFTDNNRFNQDFKGAYTLPIKDDLILYSLHLNDRNDSFLAVYSKDLKKRYELVVAKGKVQEENKKQAVQFVFNASPVYYNIESENQIELSWYYKNFSYQLTVYHPEIDNMQSLLNSLIPIN